MNAYDWTTIALILAEFGIGFTVLVSDPRRTVNQTFSLLSAFTGSWMICLLFCFHASSRDEAANIIRTCTVLGSFFPVGFNLIRLAIINPDTSFFGLILRSRTWVWIYLIVVVLSFTDSYVVDVTMPSKENAFSIPEPIYGATFYVWALYYSISIVAVFILYAYSIRISKDRMRTDLQFVFWGLLFSVCATTLLDVLLPILRGDSKSVRLAPFCVVGLQTIVAYGIASRKMLDVSILLRRFIAYGLLVASLSLIYGVVWNTTSFALNSIGANDLYFPSFLAALVTAFAMLPARTLLQKAISIIIGNLHGLDANDVLPKTNNLLRSVSTVSDVVKKFGQFTTQCSGTDFLAIYLLRNGRYTTEWTSRTRPGAPLSLPTSSALVQMLISQRKPVYKDKLLDRAPDNVSRSACIELTIRDGCLAFGIFHEKELPGIVILGPRLSGRIYDETQQATLQIMVNLLGVALENASLYTQIKASKVYVETLIDQLLSGVLVADDKGKITVINREFMRILRTEKKLLDQNINALPELLRDAIIRTQKTGTPLRDQVTTLHHNSQTPLPIRFGCHNFNPSGSAAKGTFIIVDDMTQVKRLEEQLRQSDRLSSLGTLSASVAHEIKNPLTAIKTFAQLLPESIDDKEFLMDFAPLMEREVLRIDNIVKQLLSFSKSSTNTLGKVSIQHIIEATLQLLHHNFTKKKIRCLKRFQAPSHIIWADKQKMEQVFLNLLLNAEEAMPNGGTLEIGTIETQKCIKKENENSSRHPTPHIVLQIDDTGFGIDPDVLDRIFDPFFTTKETGTGLGLSIVYGIVTEHGGKIEAFSRPEGGTRIQITLPLHTEEALIA